MDSVTCSARTFFHFQNSADDCKIPWKIHMFLWVSYGFPWFSHRFSFVFLGFPRFSYRFPRFSYGFPMFSSVFLCFPMVSVRVSFAFTAARPGRSRCSQGWPRRTAPWSSGCGHSLPSFRRSHGGSRKNHAELVSIKAVYICIYIYIHIGIYIYI